MRWQLLRPGLQCAQHMLGVLPAGHQASGRQAGLAADEQRTRRPVQRRSDLLQRRCLVGGFQVEGDPGGHIGVIVAIPLQSQCTSASRVQRIRGALLPSFGLTVRCPADIVLEQLCGLVVMHSAKARR